MGLTLGGNNSSFKNIRYLSDAKSKMDKSLLRISSGKRILTAADDSGGLSVAMKLQNQINTTKAAQVGWRTPSPLWKCRIRLFPPLETS